MAGLSPAPYRNLILTGTVGVGKTSVGRRVAARLQGAAFFDFEVELEKREGYKAEEIRARFGRTRLQTLEKALVDELTLRRSTLIAMSASPLLEAATLEKLRETGPILCLTASLGERLRRLHVELGGMFQNPETRTSFLGRMKREAALDALGLPRLDTTVLKMEAVVEAVCQFWLAEADL